MDITQLEVFVLGVGALLWLGTGSEARKRPLTQEEAVNDEAGGVM